MPPTLKTKSKRFARESTPTPRNEASMLSEHQTQEIHNQAVTSIEEMIRRNIHSPILHEIATGYVRTKSTEEQLDMIDIRTEGQERVLGFHPQTGQAVRAQA